MIVGKIHSGSGLGNQLHSILMARVLAIDKGLDYGFVGIENFKGNSFLKLDWGVDPKLEYHMEYPAGKLVVDSEHRLFEEGTNYFNPETQFIEDGTVIDGLYQDERYFGHRLPQIHQWLKVEPLEVPDDVCVIGFRGGEFALFPELFLTPDYWRVAMSVMGVEHGIKKYEVHTDDAPLAEQFFKEHGFHDCEYKVIHDIGINWRSMRYAKYAIIANSSFYILPRLLNGGVTIAPRYWARRNMQEWSMPQNFYKAFKYI